MTQRDNVSTGPSRQIADHAGLDVQFGPHLSHRSSTLYAPQCEEVRSCLKEYRTVTRASRRPIRSLLDSELPPEHIHLEPCAGRLPGLPVLDVFQQQRELLAAAAAARGL